jgi:uncharacterized protein YndB with AHSA1/START domain
MTPPIRPELIDDLIDAYVDWREECVALTRADQRWASGSDADRSLAFAAYRAALDRELRASFVYANRSGRVERQLASKPGRPPAAAVAVGRRQGGSPADPDRDMTAALPPPPEAHAPVLGTGEIDIAAPIDVVWSVLTDIAEWPSWNPEVKTAAIDGGLTPGSHFRWEAGAGTVRSRIEGVEAPRLVVWTDRTMGIRATHTWQLAEYRAGTLVRTTETFEGPIASIFRRPLQKAIDQAIRSGVVFVKAECERRAGKRGQLAIASTPGHAIHRVPGSRHVIGCGKYPAAG